MLYRATLDKIVQRLGARAGVKKRVTAHTFRHSVATHLLQVAAPTSGTSRRCSAIASLATTERYTRVEISDLQAVVRRAHPRGR